MIEVNNCCLLSNSKLQLVCNEEGIGIGLALKEEADNILFSLKGNYLYLEELSNINSDDKTYLVGIIKGNNECLVIKICIDINNKTSFIDYLNLFNGLKVIGNRMYIVNSDKARNNRIFMFEKKIRDAFKNSMINVTNIEINKIKDDKINNCKYLELVINFENFEKLHTVLRLDNNGCAAYNIVYSEAYNGLSFPISPYLIKGDYIPMDLFLYCLSKHPVVKEYDKASLEERDKISKNIRRRIRKSINDEKNTYLDISFI